MGAVTADLLGTYFADFLGEPSSMDCAPERTLLCQIHAAPNLRAAGIRHGPCKVTRSVASCARVSFIGWWRTSTASTHRARP